MKKVLVITYYWPPAGGPGVQRMLKFVKYMPQFGVKPYVLTIDENSAFYPIKDTSLLKDISSDVEITKTKSTEPLKILSKMLRKKEVPTSGFANHNKNTFSSKVMRFVRGNLFVPDARKSWVKHAYKAACEIIEREQIKTVIISTPPHSTQLVGLKLKKKYPGLNYIADLRDPWTDIYYYKDLLHTKWAARKDAGYEMQVIKASDHMLVVSRGIKELLEEKDKLAGDKIAIIPNGFDADDFEPYVSKPEHEFVISYTGTLADIYNPEVFFSVFKSLLNDYKNKCTIRSVFVGKVSPNVRAFVDKYELKEFVKFVDYVPHNEVVKYMKAATCLLLVLPDTTNEKGVLTGKLFEYLASRKPIIAIGPRHGNVEEIINECEAGKLFDRSEANQLLSYLKSLVDQWVNNKSLDLKGEKIERYSRRNLTEELCKLIN